ncbi:MAG TPA: dihydrofolate reductase family protein [Natronosporangium sp.]
MRKVVSGLFISLDGVAESPDQWQFDFDDEMAEAVMSQMEEQDAILMGRVTYQEWVDYWPTSTDEPFASMLNNTPKYVASTTLDKVEWSNSTLVRDVAAQVAALKQQPGKSIGVAGSPTLVRWLLQHDLLDELRMLVHPVVAGKGKRLFGDGDALKRLTLVDAKRTSSGTAILTYRPYSASPEQ